MLMFIIPIVCLIDQFMAGIVHTLATISIINQLRFDTSCILFYERIIQVEHFFLFFFIITISLYSSRYFLQGWFLIKVDLWTLGL